MNKKPRTLPTAASGKDTRSTQSDTSSTADHPVNDMSETRMTHHETFRDLDSDLKKIVEDRIWLIFQSFRRSMLELLRDPEARDRWNDKEYWRPYYSIIDDHEIKKFVVDEIPRYADRHPDSSYSEDISKARDGDLSCLIRLIEWDKAWLFEEGIKAQVLEAQIDGETKFLKAIGAAVAKMPGVTKAKRGEEEEDYKRLLVVKIAKTHLIRCGVPLPTTRANPFLQQFYDAMSRTMIFPERFLEIDYFMKYLMRHQIIKSTAVQ